MEEEHNDVRIPQQERSRATKEQIIETAEKLFREKGFHGTNTKEIAAEAGVAVGSVYAYFHKKKDIYLAVLNGYSERVFRRIPEYSIPPAGTPGRSKHFAGLLHAVIDAHYAPELHRDLYAKYHQDPELRKLVKNWQQKAVGEFRRSIEKAGGTAVRDAEAAAVMLHTCIEAVVQHITMYGSRISEERIIGEFAVMLDRYFT
jgi:AcrR family transcriptional regulator